MTGEASYEQRIQTHIDEVRSTGRIKSALHFLAASGGLAVVLALAVDNFVYNDSAELMRPPLSRDEATLCFAADRQPDFTFQPGDGVNDAIHQIEGAGDGPGDPCWSEAEFIVETLLDGNPPGANESITLPAGMVRIISLPE